MVAYVSVMRKNSGYFMKAQDVAKYYLSRASNDGDLITHLKMQKLVYYAYAWVLVNSGGDRLFSESIEAWPNGPVVAELYQELKAYGSMPINEDYIGDAATIEAMVQESPYRSILDDVYEQYMPKTAFELVTLTHSEQPWAEVRSGMKPTDTNSPKIQDETILAFYSK